MSEQIKLERKGHSEHTHLTGEYKYGDVGQIILFILFAAVWISDTFIFRFSDAIDDYVPFYISIPVGAAIIVLAIVLSNKSHRVLFDGNDDEPHVIDTGILGTVRHPLYLSIIIFYLGVIALHLSLAAIGVFIIACGFYQYIARYEEKLLLIRFGDAYSAYMKRVPMWIPGMK
jgi:protein-S-isoprenylcysteine O-methyltransferase Ste14